MAQRNLVGIYAQRTISGIWFHDLRRSFVTNARRSGVPESVVMKLSGHRTRSVFDRYNIIDEGDLKAAVERINAARQNGSDRPLFRGGALARTD